MSSHFDYLVVGGGSGGIASARRAAQHGARVALVEAGRLGGTCVNVGCVPKKLMWHAGDIAHRLTEAESYGFDGVSISHDWGRLVAAREAYLRRLNGIYARNLEADAVARIEGYASFVDPQTVEVSGQRYSADRILIATGGRTRWPDLPGAEHGIDSDGFFALNARPERVTVVGSGYIAVELAGVLAALGSEVHHVIRRDAVLRAFDPMLSEVLLAEMDKAGIRQHLRNEVDQVESREDGLRITLSSGTRLDSDVLLWAIGRRPNTDGLGLAAAGLTTDEGGHIPVDEWQATRQPHIFAVGDVTRGPALTPVAIAAGRRLSDRLFGGQAERRLETELVPTVVFSHPPIGTVGLSEPQAVAKYGAEAVGCYTGHFRSLYYGLLEHKVQSAVKLVTVGAEERVVGLHTIGPGSDEMLQGFAVALQCGATKRDLDDTIAIHPTASEELVTLR